MTGLTKKKYLPYMLILPVLFLMAFLYAYPIILTFIQSFHKVSLLGGDWTFVGLSNYKRFLASELFYKTLSLTVKYTVLAVFLKLFLGFVMAMFLNSDLFFSKTLKFASLIPWAIPQVAVSIVWKWILDGNYGYLNYYLIKFGIISENIAWLSSPKMAFFCAAFVDAWMGISMVSMMFLAGLNSISPSLYEAAIVDGANVVQRFFMVTLPSIKKLFMVTLTLVTIWTFNSFNAIFILTGGGPMQSTETLIIKIYQEAFSRFDLGTSSALSIIVFVILIVLASLYYKQLGEED